MITNTHVKGYGRHVVYASALKAKARVLDGTRNADVIAKRHAYLDTKLSTTPIVKPRIVHKACCQCHCDVRANVFSAGKAMDDTKA